jgi:hypothetical protein
MKPPPPILPATVQRFYAAGLPTPDQVRYETVLQQYLKLLSTSFLPLQAATLPTTDPHVVGALYNSAGTVKISAG